MRTLSNCFSFKKTHNKVVKGSFVIANRSGLHTRPSSEIVRCATRYKSEIWLRYKKETANAKSILGILMFAAPKGAEIRVEAVGVDAELAVEALAELAANQFNVAV